MGEGLPGWHPLAKFYGFGLVNVGLRPKNAKNSNLWYTIAPKGYIPLGDFYKREPQDRTVVRNFNVVALKLWYQKSPKMVIFGKNLPLWKNSGGRYENLNIGAQLQTFLYAMTP